MMGKTVAIASLLFSLMPVGQMSERETFEKGMLLKLYPTREEN